MHFFVEENQDWSEECQNIVLNIHKIGYVPLSKEIKGGFTKDSYCGSEMTAKTSVKCLLTTYISSCFDAILKYFNDNDYSDVVNRRWLLKPDLNTIGMGYYPRTNIYNVFKSKVSANSIKVSENSTFLLYAANITNNLEFISWPPVGYFPIDQLSRFWHITHQNFRYSYEYNMEITVFRDDGCRLPVKKYIVDHYYNEQSTLIIELSDQALDLCQEFRKITVSVKNNYYKEHFLYSFELFNRSSSCIDICFYDDDSFECPAKVNGKNRFGYGNYNHDFLHSSTSTFRIYVAQKIYLNTELFISNKQKIIILWNTINGKIRIFSGVEIDFQDPSETEIVSVWNFDESNIGKINSKKKPKSFFIELSDDLAATNVVSQKQLININNTAYIKIKKSIYRGRENDIFISLNYEEDNNCYLNTFVMRSYDIFYDKHYNYDVPSFAISVFYWNSVKLLHK